MKDSEDEGEKEGEGGRGEGRETGSRNLAMVGEEINGQGGEDNLRMEEEVRRGPHHGVMRVLKGDERVKG